MVEKEAANEPEGKALQLISYNSVTKGKYCFLFKLTFLKVYEMTEEAKAMLSQIEGLIAVISVAGKSRSGKSTFLNKILKIGEAFKADSNVQACTKGIWIWSKAIKQKVKGEIFNILVTDTEGLDAEDANDDHDFKIFCLTILTCSHFVYNTQFQIDRDAIDKLSKCIKLAENLKDKNELLEPQDFQQIFPKFTWLVRDFALDLVHDGKTITED